MTTMTPIGPVEDVFGFIVTSRSVRHAPYRNTLGVPSSMHGIDPQFLDSEPSYLSAASVFSIGLSMSLRLRQESDEDEDEEDDDRDTDSDDEDEDGDADEDDDQDDEGDGYSE